MTSKVLHNRRGTGTGHSEWSLVLELEQGSGGSLLGKNRGWRGPRGGAGSGERQWRQKGVVGGVRTEAVYLPEWKIFLYLPN